MALTDNDLKELFGIISYSTRKNIQYGDYLYDEIVRLVKNDRQRLTEVKS